MADDDPITSPPDPDPVGVLRRWELGGGHWRVTSRAHGRLRIDLVTCTGDEVVDVLESDDPALADAVGGRSADDD